MKILTTLLLLVGTFLGASEKINFNSQACQDEFVHIILYSLLGQQGPGYYLEIGAGEPIHINNTYALEKDCGWDGLSIDISKNLMPRWHAARNNPLLSNDATQLDYSSLLEQFPLVIDYLSLDVDGYYDIVLSRVMQSNHIFKVITIEHDAYRYGDVYQKKEREILTACGYHLLCTDVSLSGLPFEDWWIYPDFFPSTLLQKLASLNLQNKDHREIIQQLKALR